MRKLKLQMHITLDGFVGRQTGEMDWVTFDWDDELRNYCLANLDEVDLILMVMGRNTEMSFIPYWKSVAENPADPNYVYAKKVTNIPKIIFSKYLIASEWENTRVIHGEIVEEIVRLKNEPGKDLIIFGGARFASTLIKNRLIDEFQLLVNPVAIGNGLPIFNQLENKLDLRLIKSKSFDCGIVLLHYVPKL